MTSIPESVTLDLFSSPMRQMTHRGARQTEVKAAETIIPRLSELQQRLIQAYGFYGRMTGERAEELQTFSDCAPSTIRKRITELSRSGVLVADGDEPNSRGRLMTVWRLK